MDLKNMLGGLFEVAGSVNSELKEFSVLEYKTIDSLPKDGKLLYTWFKRASTLLLTDDMDSLILERVIKEFTLIVYNNYHDIVQLQYMVESLSQYRGIHYNSGIELYNDVISDMNKSGI